jgi:hypothetical protein
MVATSLFIYTLQIPALLANVRVDLLQAEGAPVEVAQQLEQSLRTWFAQQKKYSLMPNPLSLMMANLTLGCASDTPECMVKLAQMRNANIILHLRLLPAGIKVRAILRKIDGSKGQTLRTIKLTFARDQIAKTAEDLAQQIFAEQPPVTPPAVVERQPPVTPPAVVERQPPVTPPAVVERQPPVTPPAVVERQPPVTPPAVVAKKMPPDSKWPVIDLKKATDKSPTTDRPADQASQVPSTRPNQLDPQRDRPTPQTQDRTPTSSTPEPPIAPTSTTPPVRGIKTAIIPSKTPTDRHTPQIRRPTKVASIPDGLVEKHQPQPTPAMWKRPVFWAWVSTGVAVAATGVAISFGLNAQSKLNDIDRRKKESLTGGPISYRETIQPLEQAGINSTIAANIGIGIAAFGTVSAVVLFVVHYTQTPPSQPVSTPISNTPPDPKPQPLLPKNSFYIQF